MLNLASFSSRPFAESAQQFFAALGYESRKKRSFSSLEDALERLPNRDAFKTTREWKNLPFLFQFTDDEIKAQETLWGTESIQESNFKSFFFFALELQGERYTRTDLAAITRDLNKTFLNPCIALLKYGNRLSLSVIDRRPSKRPSDFERDVLGKVTLVKDIDAQSPHRAHLDILSDLSFAELRQKFDIKTSMTCMRRGKKRSPSRNSTKNSIASFQTGISMRKPKSNLMAQTRAKKPNFSFASSRASSLSGSSKKKGLRQNRSFKRASSTS